MQSQEEESSSPHKSEEKVLFVARGGVGCDSVQLADGRKGLPNSHDNWACAILRVAPVRGTMYPANAIGDSPRKVKRCSLQSSSMRSHSWTHLALGRLGSSAVGPSEGSALEVLIVRVEIVIPCPIQPSMQQCQPAHAQRTLALTGQPAMHPEMVATNAGSFTKSDYSDYILNLSCRYNLECFIVLLILICAWRS